MLLFRFSLQVSSGIPTTRTLRRSNSADVKKEILDKQNLFSYLDNGGKHAIATKGSLGIEYGQNGNITREYKNSHAGITFATSFNFMFYD